MSIKILNEVRAFAVRCVKVQAAITAFIDLRISFAP